jgi:hypothetical protein
LLEFGDLCEEELNDLESELRFFLEYLIGNIDKATKWKDLDTGSSHDRRAFCDRRVVFNAFLDAA